MDPGSGLSRRGFLGSLSALAATLAFVPRLGAEDGAVREEAVAACEELLGLRFTPVERELMVDGLAELRADYEALREVPLANDVPPAFRFDPLLPGRELGGSGRTVRLTGEGGVERPTSDEELLYLPVTDLARLLRGREIGSVELTRLCLDRIERLDPLLHAVITVTEERAMAAASRADEELARGEPRSFLHGVPWGAKDLLAAEGYPTTWGAAPYREQVLEGDATVVERLEAAGAVLVAKLTLGALAWGDVWFGETTRNPWNPEQGSSGSSAGPGAATAAGMVGFAIGSETWGSIVSPATRTGATGLRPTFGRVSRHGAMALSWTMDKLGPMCRSVEDCALVFAEILGPDGRDPTVAAAPFHWPSPTDPRALRVGVPRPLFDFDAADEEEDLEWRRFDLETLDVLRGLGCDLVPIELPRLPVSALALILSAEAAAAFDELTRSGRDDELVRQVEQAWPNVFRQARTIPAVEYVQANRVRTLVMREMEGVFDTVDLYVAPSFGGSNLLLTNLTGHPAVVLPNGFRADGTPTSISFVGRLFGEDELLAAAKLYQDATGFHLRHPAV